MKKQESVVELILSLNIGNLFHYIESNQNEGKQRSTESFGGNHSNCNVSSYINILFQRTTFNALCSRNYDSSIYAKTIRLDIGSVFFLM